MLGDTYDNEVGQEKYWLLELPNEDLLNEPSLTIRGHPKDDAILCTDDRTYSIKCNTVSNTLLLMQKGFGSVNVIHTENDIMEVQPNVIKPNMSRLEAILETNMYDGKEQEKIIEELTLPYLLDNVPASICEIQDFLKENCVLVNSSYRKVAMDYLQGFAKLLLISLAAELGWEWARLSMLNYVTKYSKVRYLQMNTQVKRLLSTCFSKLAIELDLNGLLIYARLSAFTPNASSKVPHLSLNSWKPWSMIVLARRLFRNPLGIA